MKCTVVVLVALVAGLLVTGVRSAPQRGIDFLPGDEEVQAVVKPIAPDASDVPDQQRQQGPDQVIDDVELQKLEQPEVPATVDALENEQRTEDPAAAVTEFPEDEPEYDSIDDQFTEEHEEDAFDLVTDQPEDVVQNSTSTNDSPAPAASDVTGPSQKDSTPANDESASVSDSKPVVDDSPEQRLTTEPIVVEEPDTTESNSDDSNQLAEDVNSLADDSTNQVRFGLEESNQAQPEPQARPTPQPNLTPKTPSVQRVPQAQTTEPPAPVRPVSASDEYDSKSFESHEDDDQVQLKVGPNDQFRTLPHWFSSTRVTGYDQWQPQQHQQGSSIPARSSWQPRHYQPSSFDGFHGHGFHRSSWH